jgi:hypothetical protein
VLTIESVGYQIRFGDFAGAHHRVEPATVDVGVDVREPQIDLQSWIGRGQTYEHGKYNLPAVRDGRIDAKHTGCKLADIRRRALELFHLPQDSVAALEKRLAFLREPNAPGGAVKESHAKSELEASDAFHHRRRRQSELARRRGKATVSGGFGKHDEQAQGA